MTDTRSVSDEEFLKMDPSKFVEEVEEETEVPVVAEEKTEVEPDIPVDADEPAEVPVAEEVVEDEFTPEVDEDTGEKEDPDVPEDTGEVAEEPVQEEGEVQEPAKPDEVEKPAPVDEGVDEKSLADFYKKVTAEFKADGKLVQYKSPEEIVRLVQMGVNYSRRMQEMKPLRAQDHMLKENGLNTPEKLNFLIDLSKGKTEAIKKLLVDFKIDPMDLDMDENGATPYKATNYEGDPKDIAFNDAIQETMKADGGRSLIADINKDWDSVSKSALRDQPDIFENILAQRNSGVYGRIKTELDRQRTLGYLTEVPFLQAYHQVGEAMHKAGLFNPPEEKKTVQATEVKTLATGPRKAAAKPNTQQPTPNISSATPPRTSTNSAGDTEPDYSALSDAEFLKMKPPS